jgi:hypothetical protein
LTQQSHALHSKGKAMDENTRFLIERMDQLERRLLDEIRPLRDFKNRVLGMAMVMSAAVSWAADYVRKHI